MACFGFSIRAKINSRLRFLSAENWRIRFNKTVSRQIGQCRRGASARRCQRVFDGMVHGLMHFAAVAKAHLDLGRVHVHIDTRRVDLDIQGIHRLAVAVQHVFIGAACAVAEHFVAHKTAIDIGELLIGARTGGVGGAGAAPDTHGLAECRGAGVVHPH